MKPRRTLARVGLAAFWIFGGAVPGIGADEGRISLRVGAGRPDRRGRIEVPVELGDPNGLGALDVTVRYDPQLLGFEDAEKARALESAMLVHKAAGPGKVRCGLISARPIETEGVLFTLRFTIRDPAGETVVKLTDPQAWQARDAFVLRIDAQSGTVALSASPQDGGLPRWVIGAVAGAAATAILMLAAFLVLRPRRRSA
jgi:hypothetical protein